MVIQSTNRSPNRRPGSSKLSPNRSPGSSNQSSKFSRHLSLFSDVVEIWTRNERYKSIKPCKGLDDISEDFLMEILLRLPFNTLVRFTCVSKSWSQLIGGSYFVTKHVEHVKKNAPRPSYLIALQRSRDKPQIRHSLFCYETFQHCLELRHPFGDARDFAVYGSSNGLLCISERVLSWTSPIWIWNPSIRKIRTLPETGIQYRRSKHAIALSFGFHPKVNDYKLVWMLHFRQRMTDYCAVLVYSLSTNSWKRVKVTPPWLKSMGQYWGSEFWNGVAYWLVKKDSAYRIMSFDTGSEKFEVLMVPDTISTRVLSIKVYKESICLLQVYINSESGAANKYVNLWALQEQSFEKLATFVIPGIDVLPLGFSTDNELLLERRDANAHAGDLILYHLQSKQVTETGIRLPFPKYGFYNFGSLYNSYANTYVNTLVLLDG